MMRRENAPGIPSQYLDIETISPQSRYQAKSAFFDQAVNGSDEVFRVKDMFDHFKTSDQIGRFMPLLCFFDHFLQHLKPFLPADRRGLPAWFNRTQYGFAPEFLQLLQQ